MIAMLFALTLACAMSGDFPQRVGQCGWVHGTFRISNGSSIQRLWVIGTRDKLALYDSDHHYPSAMTRLVASKRYRPFDSAISGNFRVCALERWISGHMQHIRIAAARDLILF